LSRLSSLFRFFDNNSSFFFSSSQTFFFSISLCFRFFFCNRFRDNMSHKACIHEKHHIKATYIECY
jgi:hypothetical protein